MRTFGLSTVEQETVWAQWRTGVSLRLIARRLGKHTPAVRGFVLETGGVYRRPPTRPQRS
jgi:hypothetical protein